MAFSAVGQRIEEQQGQKSLFFLVLVIGVLSNFVEYIVSGVHFGGLSGVVYGVLAYCWIWDKCLGGRYFDIPNGVMTIMFIWLLLCILGLPYYWFGVRIANGAHVGGLLIGAVIAWYQVQYRLKLTTSI